MIPRSWMVLGWPNIQYGFIEVGSKCVGQAMEFLNDNKLQQESHNDGMKYVHNMNEVSQSILQPSTTHFQVTFLITAPTTAPTASTVLPKM